MELKKIQYFLRIVDQGSLSKAAESLYLTQPTLSRFLAKLEEEAGIQLFHRQHNSSLQLTEAGQVYLRAARAMDGLWQSMERELEELKNRERTFIRLGIDDDRLQAAVQASAAAIAQRYPNVTLESRYLNSAEIQSAILRGTLDLGLTSYFRLSEQLAYSRLERNEIDLVVAPSHPLARYSYQLPGQEGLRISPDRLDPDTPFLLMREGSVLRECVDRYMQSIRFVPHVPTTYSRHDLLGRMLPENPALVSFCPRNQRFPELAYIAVDPPFYHRRGICFLRSRTLTPAEKLLIRLLSAPK